MAATKGKTQIAEVVDPIHDFTDAKITVTTHGDHVIQTWFEEISPKRAREMLKNLVHNQRDVSQDTVAAYTQDMKNGRWNSVADPIRFYNDGQTLQLDNGQHRLHAIIASKKTLNLLCLAHNDKDSFKAVDNGRSRKLHEVMKIDGVQSTVRMSSFATACRIALGLEASAAMGARVSNIRVRQRYSHTAVLDYLKTCPDFLGKVEEVTQTYNTGRMEKIVPLSNLLAFYYYFSDSHPEVIRNMFYALENKGYPSDGLGPNSPIFVFTDWIREKKEQRVRLDQQNYMNGMLWCLSNMAHNRSVDKFNYRADYIFGQDHVGADAVIAKIKSRENSLIKIVK